MTASGLFIAPGDSIQRSQRGYREFTDQHGRVFAAQVDVRNGHPVEEMRCISHSPPWLPPQMYAKFRRIHDVTFAWNYDPLANELSGDTAQYYKDARTIALREKLPVPEVGGIVDPLIRDILAKPPLSPAIPLACAAGDPWILGVQGAPDTLGLQEILEQGYRSNAKEVMAIIKQRLADAAMTHAIPLVPTIAQPEEVEPKRRTIHDIDDSAPFETVTYPAFVKACRKRGMSMPDIVAAWHEQKLLAAETAAAGLA